jgi:hypothetical protein
MNTEIKNCEYANCENVATEKIIQTGSVTRWGKVYPTNEKGVLRNVCSMHYTIIQISMEGCE